METISIKKRIRNISFLDGIKIAIIIFAALAFLGNFIPYYIGNDTLVYAATAINLADGNYGITNELLIEFDDEEVLPRVYAKSVHDTAIPFASSGMTILTTFSYLVAGYYGLFYQGPIIAIIFLIVSERIATKLFGGLVGLITLVLLVTDLWILKSGAALMTDIIFSLFLLLGFFFLIKFFQEGKSKLILFCSIFLVTSAFFRYTGMIVFPIEIVLFAAFLLFQRFQQGKSQITKNHNGSSKITFSQRKINIPKSIIFLLIPWIIYFSFWFSFNAYYFDDPLTNLYDETPYGTGQYSTKIPGTSRPDLIPSLLTFDSNRFEWIQFYLVAILPDAINSSLQQISPWDDPAQNKNLLGSLISFGILLCGLGISLFQRNKRLELITILSFMLVFVLIFSSYYLTYIDLRERYLVPVLALTFMIIGFIINEIWKHSLRRFFDNQSKIFLRIFQIGLLIFLIVLVTAILYDNKKIQGYLESEITFNNPADFTKRYPLEKLPEKSIIVESSGIRTLEYNSIYFNPGIKQWAITGENPDAKSQGSIQKLKNLMQEGYQVYSFKNQLYDKDPHYFRYIEKNHDIILKDYSESFCKLEQINELKEIVGMEKAISDEVCYRYNGEIVPKK